MPSSDTTVRNLHYHKIADFSPGIFSHAEGAEFKTGSSFPVPAPPGAAQEKNTYGCIALPGGGLGPLPRVVDRQTIPTLGATKNVINMFRVIGEVNPSSGSGSGPLAELHVGVAWDDGSNLRQEWYRGTLLTNPAVWISLAGFACAASPFRPQMMTSGLTRPTSASVANITLAASVFAGVYRFFLFPDPSAPGSNTPYTDTTHAGNLFCHQGRVFLLAPYSTAHGATAFSTSNENIQYTDPPLSSTMGSQQVLFSPENPYGYGAWGSISSGELFLVKIQGGAVMVTGDVFYPSITRLPGVVSTGQLGQEATPTSVGLIYCAEGMGAYAWGGGSTSQKISPQLRDDFFMPVTLPTYMQPPASYGRNTFVQHHAWYNWVLFPNNWLYDTLTQSWWLLDNPNVASTTYTWFHSYATELYAAISSYDNGATNQVAHFHLGSPVLTYSWTSQPIALAEGRLVEIRELELLAAGPDSVNTVQVTIADKTGSTVQETFTFGNSSYNYVPFRIRLNTAISATMVSVNIVATGNSTSAPAIYNLSLGWRESVSN